jgi:hypothetical protein
MTKITYIAPEKIRVNGKLITIMSGSSEHLKDLTPKEQKDLSQFIISLHRGELKVSHTVGEYPKNFNDWQKEIHEEIKKL